MRCCRPPSTTAGWPGTPRSGGASWPKRGWTPSGSSPFRPSRVRTPSVPRPRRPLPPAGGGPCCRSPPRPERVRCSTSTGSRDHRLAPSATRDRRAGRAHRPTLVGWTWREAAWLGLVALGAVTAFAEVPMRAGKPMSERLAALFPSPVDRIVIQADLTAVTPGPPAYALARDLRLLADQESRGGGGVFRFSAASMRRAFDAGWSAADVHRWLAEHSSTGVPQPLRVSRRRRAAAVRQHPGRAGRVVPAGRGRGPGGVAAQPSGRRRIRASADRARCAGRRRRRSGAGRPVARARADPCGGGRERQDRLRSGRPTGQPAAADVPVGRSPGRRGRRGTAGCRTGGTVWTGRPARSPKTLWINCGWPPGRRWPCGWSTCRPTAARPSGNWLPSISKLERYGPLIGPAHR